MNMCELKLHTVPTYLQRLDLILHNFIFAIVVTLYQKFSVVILINYYYLRILIIVSMNYLRICD